LRAITNHTVNKEPRWRHPRAEITTGYEPRYYGNGQLQGTVATH
jgi:hydrogenase small subunit